MPNIIADLIGQIKPVTDTTILANVLTFLRDENECETVLDLPGCFVGVAENYMTDGPGYHGPVYVILWTGGPKAITTLTCDAQGDFVLAANHGA